MRIYKEFQFEAAHYLPSAPLGSPNARVHGHSFRARVSIDGMPGNDTGYVFHFDELAGAMAEAQDALDHRLLNEVEGLGKPTLENLAKFIFLRAKAALPETARVKLRRPSYGQTCTYEEV